MADINLLQTPTTQSTSVSNRSRVFLARLLMFVLLLVVVAFGGLKLLTWQAGKSITSTQAQVSAAQTEALNNKDRKELITRQGQSKELDALVKEHLYWSYMLPELAQVTLRTAQYQSITLDNEGKLLVTVSLPSYEELDKYMQVFDLPEYNKQFSNVKILSISRQQVNESTQTIVRLELTFDPDFLKGKM